jgi:recombination protein RecR
VLFFPWEQTSQRYNIFLFIKGYIICGRIKKSQGRVGIGFKYRHFANIHRMIKYPSHLLKLIEVLRRLPGVGSKSAERFAFEILNWPEEHLDEMAKVISQTHSQLLHCPECGCLTDCDACAFCMDSTKSSKILCIVSSAKDAFAIESTREHRGHYHVLGGLLSPIAGRGPEQLRLDKLKERILSLGIEEILIALDSTLEGDATSLYLKQALSPFNLTISRLAFGLPMGSSLDYVDGGTLAHALAARGRF